MTDNISPDVLQRLKNVAQEKGISVDDLLGRWLDSHNTTLTRHVTDMISRHTPDGTYTYATPSATTLIGYKPDELVGRSAYDFFHPDDLRIIRQSHDNIIERSDMQIVSYRIRHKNGHYIWFETTSRTVHDPQTGEIREIIAVSRNITQRKQTEAYLQGVLDSSPLGIMGFRAVRDEANTITDFEWTLMNTHSEIMVGYKQTDLLGKRLLEVMPGNKTSGLFDRYVDVVETGNTLSMEQYYRYEQLDAWYHITAVKLDDGFVVTFADITIPKKAQEALRQSEASYRLLFQEAPIAIWKRDFSAIKTYLEGIVLSGVDDLQDYLRKNPEEVKKCLRMVRTIEANHTALQTYGATSVEQVNAHFSEIAQMGEPQPASLAALLSATSYGDEFINKKLDTGEDIYLLMKWIVMPGHEEHFDEVLVVTVDITDQKKAQFYQMEQARVITQFRKEQEHNALIQRSISALSHDIRTPLAVVSTSKDLLLRHFDKLTEEKRREKLESIGRQLEFAIELIDDTVMTVRGELSKRPFRPTATRLEQLCQVSVSEVGSSYNARGRLHFENKAGISQVMVDDILVSRILMNLLSNAIKYSPPNTPITLELDKDEANLIICISDKGIGIAPEHLPHIFEPFYRVDENSPVQGTGLGLSIVKECVERHNGQIEVESEVGVGTTFTVCLPYVGV